MMLRLEVEGDLFPLEKNLSDIGLTLFAAKPQGLGWLAFFEIPEPLGHDHLVRRVPEGFLTDLKKFNATSVSFCDGHLAYDYPAIVRQVEDDIQFAIEIPEGRIFSLNTDIHLTAKITNLSENDLEVVIKREHIVAATFLNAGGEEMLEMDPHEEDEQVVTLPPGKTLEDDNEYHLELLDPNKVWVEFGSVIESFNGSALIFTLPATPLLFQ